MSEMTGRTKGVSLEDAITAALPGEMEFYTFIPLLLMHFNGKCYGVMGKSQAAVWWHGADARERSYFHFEDLDGNRVEGFDVSRGFGHAGVIMEKLG